MTTTFDQMGLIAPLAQAVREEGYTTPTPIQTQAIPHLLRGADLLGCAQTGTGKTAAFALPILQRLQANMPPKGARRPIRSLILTPTRELAIQIEESLRAYGRHLPLRHLVIFGGVGQQPQVNALQQGVDILVATPGRLLDLMSQGYISLQHLEVFVLDEADRMLDMGFIHDVKRVIVKLPEVRQTLFFSATMPAEIQGLANTILRNPVKVEVTPASSTVEKIEQLIFPVEKAEKRHLLLHLLQNDPTMSSVLVFTRTKHGADRVVKDLQRAGVSAQAIHGNKSQNARQDALQNFKNGKTRILVATDIAARGIDIDDLGHVINYELPNIPETYVHRIGRTGRAGASGMAISFCEVEEQPFLKDIQKLIGKKLPHIYDHPFNSGSIAPATAVTAPPPARQAAPARQQQPQDNRRQQASGHNNRPAKNAAPALQGADQPPRENRDQKRNDRDQNQARDNRNPPRDNRDQQRRDQPLKRTNAPLPPQAKQEPGQQNQQNMRKKPPVPQNDFNRQQPVQEQERNFNNMDESQNHAPLESGKRRWVKRESYVEVPQPPQPKPKLVFGDEDRW